MRPNAGRICQRTSQFRHGQVAVLINQFEQKGVMRIKLAFAERAPLGRGPCLTSPADRKTPKRPVAGESFKHNAAVRPLDPSSINC